MNLYLVRHGTAVNSTVNPSRPLSLEGIREIERLHEELERRNIFPSVVYHSSKLRARETAHILFPKSSFHETEALLPNALLEPIMSKVIASALDLAIVGHLPFLENFVIELTSRETSYRIPFETGQFIILGRENGAEFIFQDAFSPKNLI